MAILRRFQGYVTAIVLLFTIVSAAQAKYSGGTGEPNDPYQIATAEDLMLLGETPEDYDKHFILTADIDLDPNLPGRKVFDKAVIAPDINDVESGYQGNSFSGVFDGDGHIIWNLTITGGDYLGLFGQVDYEATVSNLGLEVVNVSGTGANIGSLAGQNNGSITSSYSTGSVSGDHDVGGLVGDNNNGAITQCYSAVEVSGDYIVGGLAGNNAGYYGGYINQCYSTGTVSGDKYGGLVSSRPFGRGALKYSMGTVIDSFWDIETSGQVASNGGTGKTTEEMKTYRTFLRWGTCCDEGTWTIDEGNDYPHLAWEHRPGIVLDFLLSDFLEGSGTEEDPYLIYTYYDIDMITFFPCEEDKFFRLAFLEGRGAHDNPYQLANAEQLNMIGMLQWEWDKQYKLVADIDLSIFDGKDGRPAFKSISTFTGIFDGDGHKISNLTATMGLFGRLESGAEVRDLAVVDVNIIGSGGVGGLVGQNFGVLIQCYSTGIVRGSQEVGGLVGRNGSWDKPGGTVSHCYSTVLVKGGSDVGGLVGENDGSIVASYSSGSVNGTGGYIGGLVGNNFEGSIATSYSTAAVSGKSTVGGLVGYNYTGTVTHCYSVGSVSGDGRVGGLVAGSPFYHAVWHSVWNIETSGQFGSVGGVGLTTAEMMDPHMLGLNGFANDPNWVLDSGRDYPRLAWEGTPGSMIPEPPIDWLEGQGTLGDPYRIDTADQLMLLTRASALWEDHLILGADIDLDPNLSNMRVFEQPPIQFFKGIFNGDGHVITNMEVTGIGQPILGLFGRLEAGGEIKDLGIMDVNITGYGGPFGGLVGENYGSIAGCYSSGSVSGTGFQDATGGGLAGYNAGCIRMSHSFASVSRSGQFAYVGGLVGQNSSTGTVIHCWSTGPVSGTHELGSPAGLSAGGLVGDNNGNVIASYSNGSVSGTGWPRIGGLVGDNSVYGSVTQCYSTGPVSGEGDVGGLVGDNWGSVAMSYSTGAVTGEDQVGGLVGDNMYGVATDCFWDIETSGWTTSAAGTGLATAEMQDINTYLNAGWDFVDETVNGIEDYWQISPGGYPELCYVDDSHLTMLEGLGTLQQPYLIRDTRDLATVRFSPQAHYRLAESVDLSEFTYSIAVIPWFGGSFDGNGFVISNLHIHGTANLGLFGQLISGASISNLGVETVNVNGTGSNVGGLVGYNEGSITTSYTTGSVSGDWEVGGLVGDNRSNITMSHSTATVRGNGEIGGLVGWNLWGNINMSYSNGITSGNYEVGGLVGRNQGSMTTSFTSGTISGNSEVGGLVGFNGDDIVGCYSNAAVNGQSEVGGLVGDNFSASITMSYSTGAVSGLGSREGGVGGLVGSNMSGSITTSYSTGAVSGTQDYVGGLVGFGTWGYNGTVAQCFWDVETSGQATSYGGTGKTTAEMKTQNTFTDAGWDFVDETANGTEDIWWILEGQDYPRLWWEAAEP